MKDQEIWKDIQGYEGLYKISTHGRVYAYSKPKFNGFVYYNHEGRFLKLSDNGVGYKYVRLLDKEGKYKKYYIHRLVASAFIPNPDEYPQVNHKDENPGNNNLENLEWCTQKYNNRYGNRMNKQLTTMVAHKFNTPIDVYDRHGNFVCSFNFTKSAAKFAGISREKVIMECDGIADAECFVRFAYKGERPADKFAKKQRKRMCELKIAPDNSCVSWYNTVYEAEKDNNLPRYSIYKKTKQYKNTAIINNFKYTVLTY